jgi:hypothetical protein
MAAMVRRGDVGKLLEDDPRFMRFLETNWFRRNLLRQAVSCLTQRVGLAGPELTEKRALGLWYQFSVESQFTDRTARVPELSPWERVVKPLARPHVNSGTTSEETVCKLAKSIFKQGSVWSIPDARLTADDPLPLPRSQLDLYEEAIVEASSASGDVAFSTVHPDAYPGRGTK